MNTEQRRSIEHALKIVRSIRAVTTCPDPAEGGCIDGPIPGQGCVHEAARSVIADLETVLRIPSAVRARTDGAPERVTLFPTFPDPAGQWVSWAPEFDGALPPPGGVPYTPADLLDAARAENARLERELAEAREIGEERELAFASERDAVGREIVELGHRLGAATRAAELWHGMADTARQGLAEARAEVESFRR